MEGFVYAGDNTLNVLSYTPTFRYTSGAAPTVENIVANYFTVGDHLAVFTIRFNITDVGSPVASDMLEISMPSRVTIPATTVGPVGIWFAPNGPSNLILRQSVSKNAFNIVNGSGGGYSGSAIVTGYQSIFAIVAY